MVNISLCQIPSTERHSRDNDAILLHMLPTCVHYLKSVGVHVVYDVAVSTGALYTTAMGSF